MPTSTPPPSPLALEVQGLSVHRGTTVLLADVSCQIRRGQVVALLGPNGCGKTTLTRVITGAYFATQGRVTVLGEVLGEADVRALRRRIGLVNPTVDGGGQHAAGAVVDADLSVTEAVLTGFFGTIGLYDSVTEAQRQRASDLLTDVGLGHRREHRFGLLSTGEARRALLARALVRRPELLILDEPTNGLDIAGREHLLATLSRLMTQPDAPAVLFITHHVEELPAQTSEVFLMRDGRFLEHGPPDAVLTPEKLSATFGCKVFVKKTHGRFWLEVLPEAWLDLTG